MWFLPRTLTLSQIIYDVISFLSWKTWVLKVEIQVFFTFSIKCLKWLLPVHINFWQKSLHVRTQRHHRRWHDHFHILICCPVNKSSDKFYSAFNNRNIKNAVTRMQWLSFYRSAEPKEKNVSCSNSSFPCQMKNKRILLLMTEINVMSSLWSQSQFLAVSLLCSYQRFNINTVQS